MNVRLYPNQVERLKKSGNGASIIRYAFDRFKRGDFGDIVVQNKANERKEQTVPLESFSIRQRFPINDALLREILRLHWQMPDTQREARINAEISSLDAEIAGLFKAYANINYIEEKTEE